jgi:diacylglycerol kinase family enzyme
LLFVALLAVSAVAARVALLPDIHELRRVRFQHDSFRPRHPVLICNPKSGGGKVAEFDIVEEAERLGVEVVLLEAGDDLARLAHDAVSRGADCLGMAGGDGSQAMVASVAIARGVPFVCVSAGTRNHFAQDLGIDVEDPRKGLAAFTHGLLRRVDYATVGDRLFVNNVSLGVYAAIVQDDSYRDAKLATAQEQLPMLLGKDAEPFDLQFTTPGGEDIDGAFLILVSNNPYVLGPVLDVGERRVMNSGTLGVVAVTATNGAEAVKAMTRSAVGLAAGGADPNIHRFEVEQFEVRSRSGAAAAGVDGEALTLDTPLRMASHPGGLELLTPPAAIDAAVERRARGIKPGALWRVATGRRPRAQSL